MAKIDILKAIAPKSDQLNADDLLTGPRTIRLTGVTENGGDQPISIHFDGDNGRPWKPSKTALRCFAAVWSDDPDKWPGLHCTIYNDENVKWGGVAVGGIRVSHMEGLTKPRELKLTVTRGKKAGTVIQPLIIEKESKADKFRARLFEVAEDAEKSVSEAWGKVPAEMKAELGEALLEQLLAVEAAAAEHRANDPDAAVNALNAEIAGE